MVRRNKIKKKIFSIKFYLSQGLNTKILIAYLLRQIFMLRVEGKKDSMSTLSVSAYCKIETFWFFSYRQKTFLNNQNINNRLSFLNT